MSEFIEDVYRAESQYDNSTFLGIRNFITMLDCNTSFITNDSITGLSINSLCISFTFLFSLQIDKVTADYVNRAMIRSLHNITIGHPF